MKSGDNWLGGLREEDILRLHDLVYVHSPEARADNPQGTIFQLQLKSFTTLIYIVSLSC